MFLFGVDSDEEVIVCKERALSWWWTAVIVLYVGYTWTSSPGVNGPGRRHHQVVYGV